ncbi:uncharacterized protein RHO25_009592 [Cercospora beticola]|uniref:FAD-binding domain-containing protein n=1 Tax=Cercospora beticola TaxID=122368 RepID=A0ABZ0NZB0_CERBT|nr:hypothetical protein RHO25_009592 [Cercospora beticola]
MASVNATQDGAATSSPHFKRQLQTIIVGCGLGSLSLAIQLRHSNQKVLILEKAAQLSELGAGIQLPPNATRILSQYDLLPKIYEAGMNLRKGTKILRWSDGSMIGHASADDARGDWWKEKFGYPAHVIHRADYQRVLVDEAKKLGVDIRLDAEVVDIERCSFPPAVRLARGEVVTGDVIVGRDGLHSKVRTAVLGHVKEAEESGDLAYRVTVPIEKAKGLEDGLVKSVLAGDIVVY